MILIDILVNLLTVALVIGLIDKGRPCQQMPAFPTNVGLAANYAYVTI